MKQSSENPGYSFVIKTSNYGGIAQRWLVVESEKRKESDLRKLEKKLTKKQLLASQLLARLSRSKFESAAEAKAIIKVENKKLKYHQLNLVKLIKVKDKKLNKYVYQIEATLTENSEIIAAEKKRAGRFILATNILETQELSADEMLRSYREQQSAERGFAFLKDPLFFADAVYLKTSERIEAMAMLMGLCLLVYKIGQRQLRLKLSELKTGVKNQYSYEVQFFFLAPLPKHNYTFSLHTAVSILNFLVNNFSTDLHTINKSSKVRPIKVLHVVSYMHRAGIETWLMHVLRNIDHDLFQMDFMVHFPESYEYDDEIRSLGCRIIFCPKINWKRWWDYSVNFQQRLQKYGPYDVVHSHVDIASGNIVRLAKNAGVPVCIVHSHNDKSQIRAKQRWKGRFLEGLLKFCISRYATLGLACSRDAAADMFGSRWQNDRRWQVLYYGLDFTPFQEPVDSARVRAELDIPEDAFVIGHVGRFDPQKNHQFLIDIAAEIAQQEPNMRLLLIGTGSLRSEIEKQVSQLGLTDKVIFAGVRSDVPRLMLGAMDVFLFPSLYEGLGLVLIEAQAAGLPCIFSDVVPEEADVVKPLMNRLPLSQSASEWAEVVLAQRNADLPIKQSEALSILQDSPFNIETCVKNLTDIYHS